MQETEEVRRVAFSLTPAEPLFSEIIAASQGISAEFDNDNVIDATRYPPHLSLHICTMPVKSLEDVVKRLADALQGQKLPTLDIAGVFKGSRGYISVRVERAPELATLHEAVIEAAAAGRQGMAEDPREHHRHLSERQRANYEHYGNAFVLDAFDPHFSVAKVDDLDQREALRIAEHHIQSRHAASIELQLVDIGMRNEKWDVVRSIAEAADRS